MHFEKRRANSKTEIPTASMPDIIFMLLMFFMTVTTMREVDVLVDYKLPEAKAIEKIESKRLVAYIWVGKDKRMQINDSLVKMNEIENIMFNKKQALPEVIVSLRADQGIDMGLITDVQQELRKAFCLRINYSTNVKI